MIGFAELLAEELKGPLNEDQKRFADHIIRDSRHLLDLINDILDLSKMEAGGLELRREIFDGASAIGEVLSQAIEAGGSSISDYVDAEGRKGFFQFQHRVYQRTGEPCVACGAPVKRVLVAQRSSHYCPRGQKR